MDTTSPQDAVAALETERTAAQAHLTTLEADLMRIVEATRDANTDDEHDPEGATIAFERAQVIALIEQTRTRLTALDEALHRVAAGTYGVCDGCGQPIPPLRLQARPTATRCVACASAS